MKFEETGISGALEIDLEMRGDERGFFARVFCREEMAEHRLNPLITQVNSSMSVETGTLRGLHYQVAPHGETKLVRCIGGEIFDVVLDLREGSRSFGKWYGTRLSAENRRMLFVPAGCAHGFLTLQPRTEIIYFVSAGYQAASERVVRWNDPRFAIEWPVEPKVLSEKDRAAADFSLATHNSGY
ncbi:MAG: dTDP-4-dehydrorhamnose 3,5-epimerase [Sphingomonas sp.]|jgi:dTDP-4-dehydrorhamnose 3,5-epimerase